MIFHRFIPLLKKKSYIYKHNDGHKQQKSLSTRTPTNIAKRNTESQISSKGTRKKNVSYKAKSNKIL